MSGYSSNEHFVGDSKVAAYGTNNPVRFIPTDRALAFMDEFKRAGVLAVQHTGGGEPSAHPDHEKIFEKCLSVGLKASLVSNGLRWSENLIQKILPRFSWVRVSVDAGGPATYASIRRTPADNFHKVVRHIGRLAEAIKLTGSPCTLGVGYVVTPENWKEIDDGIAVAKGTGARYIRLSAMFNPDDDAPYRAIYDDIREAIHTARLRYETGTFSVVDLFGERIQDLVDGRPDYRTCSYQHYTTYIGGDLKPYRCCVLAYNTRGQVDGPDLATTGFDTFWASQERVRDFERFDARGCERCQFNAKNRAMAYLIGEAPTHAEFP
jgi:MoaA/NifB/PqqE/SkfB family radical SAM enzyme